MHDVVTRELPFVGFTAAFDVLRGSFPIFPKNVKLPHFSLYFHLAIPNVASATQAWLSFTAIFDFGLELVYDLHGWYSARRSLGQLPSTPAAGQHDDIEVEMHANKTDVSNPLQFKANPGINEGSADD